MSIPCNWGLTAHFNEKDYETFVIGLPVNILRLLTYFRKVITLPQRCWQFASLKNNVQQLLDSFKQNHKTLLFQRKSPAVFSAPCCYLPPSEISVFCWSGVYMKFCIVNILECAGAWVNECAYQCLRAGFCAVFLHQPANCAPNDKHSELLTAGLIKYITFF